MIDIDTQQTVAIMVLAIALLVLFWTKEDK